MIGMGTPSSQSRMPRPIISSTLKNNNAVAFNQAASTFEPTEARLFAVAERHPASQEGGGKPDFPRLTIVCGDNWLLVYLFQLDLVVTP